MEEVIETKQTEGVSLTIKAKRGTGTNDRDEVKGKVHALDMDELEEKRTQMRAVIEDELEHVRSIQPDEDED